MAGFNFTPAPDSVTGDFTRIAFHFSCAFYRLYRLLKGKSDLSQFFIALASEV